MNLNLTFETASKNTFALKAIGLTLVYLSDGPCPWDRVTDFSPGGMMRNGTEVSGVFTASIDGIDYSWHFDLELPGANGAFGFKVDVDGCQRVMGLLPDAVRLQFRNWLASVAAKISSRCAETVQWLDNQTIQANALRDMAKWNL